MRSNWPAFEIVTTLIRETAGYARGALIDPFYIADASKRERRQGMLAELRAKLFDAQQKAARGRD